MLIACCAFFIASSVGEGSRAAVIIFCISSLLRGGENKFAGYEVARGGRGSGSREGGLRGNTSGTAGVTDGASEKVRPPLDEEDISVGPSTPLSVVSCLNPTYRFDV